MEPKQYHEGSSVISEYSISLQCNNSMYSATVIDHGATLTSFSKDGHDILLGYNNPFDYTSKSNPYLGAIVGRSCNRTAKGKFSINEVDYQLPINNGPNSLHGGNEGINSKRWDVTTISPQKLEFTCISNHVNFSKLYRWIRDIQV
jgi:aldose 1-epimerase